MYVPGLKKTIVYVMVLEDHGYDVIFNKRKDFLRNIATGQVTRIGVHVKNLYKLDAEYCATLCTKEKMVQSRDVSELWHRILDHLHHGALKIMRHISMAFSNEEIEQRDT